MSKPLSELTLYERLDPAFTDVCRAKSALSLAADKLRNLDHEKPGFDLTNELQVVIDTLEIVGRALKDIGGEIESRVIDFEEHAKPPASELSPPALHPGPPQLVVDNTRTEPQPA